MIKLFHRELANGVGRGVSKTVGGVTIWQQVEGEGKLVVRLLVVMLVGQSKGILVVKVVELVNS